MFSPFGAQRMASDVLKINNVTILPVIHGSGDFALAVRERMLAEKFDCVVVPLPPSFQAHVEQAIAQLPTPAAVTQAEPPTYRTEWSPDETAGDNEGDPELETTHSYVPIDACQPVIAALRVALEEHIPRAFIDLETERWQPIGRLLPDAYALKKVSLERFAAAMLPAIGPPPTEQFADRCLHMGARLAELAQRYESILLVCSVLEWPWIRDAYRGVGLQTCPNEIEETGRSGDLPHQTNL
jgi:hypothetical protein